MPERAFPHPDRLQAPDAAPGPWNEVAVERAAPAPLPSLLQLERGASHRRRPGDVRLSAREARRAPRCEEPEESGPLVAQLKTFAAKPRAGTRAPQPRAFDGGARPRAAAPPAGPQSARREVGAPAGPRGCAGR